MKRLSVDFDQITPSDFCCGNILSGSDGEQYIVVDVFPPDSDVSGYAFLDRLDENERIEPEYVDGQVNLSASTEELFSPELQIQIVPTSEKLAFGDFVSISDSGIARKIN
jgi:hypothetical protein